MSVSATLDSYLTRKAGKYDTVIHAHTTSASDSALQSNIPLKQMAKGVVLHDQDHYMMAVIPAMNKVALTQVEEVIGRPAVLAKETEIERLFKDCEPGAVPAIGQAYGLNVVWDDSLMEDADLYLEAGDHRHLIHLTREQFNKLMRKNPHGTISCAPEDLHDMRYS